MLPRFQRLTSAQFDRAFGHSQSVRHPLLALKAHYRDDDCDIVRAAFVVPKKQARAVSRNRTRRRLRERYRLHPRRNELNGCDLIFLSTPATHDASGAELDEALDEVMRRMKRKLGAGADFGSANPFAARPGKAGKCRPSPTAAETVSTKVDYSADGGQVANGFAEPKSALAEPAISSQTSIFAAPALAVIRFYQRFVSPGLPPSCRFYPSCSRYTYGAIERFGLARGLWLGAYRVCRCHPWNAGGIDEVPAYFPAPHVVKARALEKFKALISRRRFDSPRN